jgi:hypothetical protein
MFNYLIYKGYLSSGKRFDFSSDQARDTKSIMGANVLTGKGVCRHTASMLADILNDSKIEAGVVGVCAQSTIINIETLKEQKYTKEELINWLHSHSIDEDTTAALTEIIEYLDADNSLLIELQYRTEEEQNIIRRILGNHVITYAYKDGISYYLDATQDRIYTFEDRVLSDSEITLHPKLISSLLFNKFAINANVGKRIAQRHPSLPIEEQKRIKAATLDVCKSNIDVFEQFYNDNKGLYEETSDMILSLKKRNSIFSKKQKS